MIQRHTRIHHEVDSIFKWAKIWGTIGSLVWIALVCGIGYVAWHFISKYW